MATSRNLSRAIKLLTDRHHKEFMRPYRSSYEDECLDELWTVIKLLRARKDLDIIPPLIRD
jgi:hypothetical protein